jgi:glycosyltransferase involved in cell wall biosynthesis
MSAQTTEEAPLRILISAYACAPNSGSEPGAGWSILKAASHSGECWVLTRRKNVAPLLAVLRSASPRHEVHVIGLDLKPWVLSIKRRLGGLGVRLYYLAWQRLVRREAMKLEILVGFDVAHHVTFSAFWLPVGIDRLKCPLVIGPLSGGERTPPSLLRYLGVRGVMSDLARYLVTTLIGLVVAARWRRSAFVFVSQSKQMAHFARRFVGPRSRHLTFSHALDPAVEPPLPERRAPEVLFVGRLVPWKGVALALDAVAAAKVDARFTVIGEGGDRGRLVRKVKNQRQEEAVVFAGSLNRSEVLRRMASSSALLFPSFHDSAGFVVSEALSIGLPVICLNHAGPGEIVSQWPSALSVPVAVGSRERVVADLASGIEKFIRNPPPQPPSPITSRESLNDLVAKSYRIAIELSAKERLPT